MKKCFKDWSQSSFTLLHCVQIDDNSKDGVGKLFWENRSRAMADLIIICAPQVKIVVNHFFQTDTTQYRFMVHCVYCEVTGSIFDITA